MSLPSSQELQEAAKNGDSEKCQELVLQAITYGTAQHESLKARTQEACTVLADAWEDCSELENALVDALWLSGSMITSLEEQTASKESFDALVEIVKVLVQIPDRNSFWIQLQGNLMPTLIDAAGLASSQEFLKKLKIHNTQVHYKQQKYNLLQEESEGYSKVLQYLAATRNSGQCGNSNDDYSYLRKLMGTFELDPNRVLDLAIDFLEASLYPNANPPKDEQEDRSKPDLTEHCRFLLGVMKELCVDKLTALIGFKMTSTSPMFLRTVAVLAVEGLLDLKTMMNCHFGRLQEDIGECHKVMWMKEKKKILAMSRVSLTGTTKVDPKQAELEEQFETLVKPLKANLFLDVLLLMIHWGEWGRVKALFSFDIWSQLCSIMPEEFGFALCDVAQNRTSNWLRMTVATPNLSKLAPSGAEAMDEMATEVSIDEVVAALSDSLLCVVKSACIGHRPVLFCQICRLFRSLLGPADTEHQVSPKTYSFFKTFLVPSMSLFSSNPAISTELWVVLKRLPYATRYRLYEDWRGAGLERAGLSSSPRGKPLPNVLSEMEAGKAARYALKRLSKDNIRDISRQLAKVTHSNPLVVYATILSQIESYDNMVEVMVEAQRFVNPLGLDVLGYCILGRLSGKTGGINRSRLKDDGVNVSQWLQSLESFTGAFFRRCPFVEFRGMLCYLMRRLREGNVMELGILRTLLKVTGGYSFADYSPAASLNVTQLKGRAGSRMLKVETMSFGIVEETNQKASDRIRHVLQTAGFGVSMLIHIAQVRSRILFESTKSSPKEVKLLGNLYDSCQVVMSILLDFLLDYDGRPEGKDGEVYGSILKYAENLPTLEELHTKFGVDAVSTWMLCRPLVRSANSANGSKEASGSSDDKLKRFTFSSDFRKTYQAMLPEHVWSVLSADLFEYFYTHGIYDILCPEKVYDSELNRVNKEIERLQQRQKGGGSTALHTGPTSQKDEAEELGRLKTVSSGLASDLSQQKEHVAAIESKMDEMKNSFFVQNGTLRDLGRAFFVYCILPRSTQSPDDAMYCARFCLRLHRLECPRFSTLHYIDELISVVSGSLFGVTEGEAAHLAILLWETWKVVNKWRYEDGLYDAEVAGKPGSLMYLEDESGDEVASSENQITHEEFSALYNKWHASLGSALIGCLKSSEYMHSRAGLVVLTRIVEVFPTRPKLGNKLLQVLAPLQDESSSRPDIRASANAYGTMLLRARDEGKWVEEDAAVAKARADKERMAAEARKKKIAEQFQEFERDNEKITEEIGPRDGIRDRNDRRRDYAGGRALPADMDRGRNPTGTSAKENGKSRLPAVGRMESGEVPSGREHEDRRGGNVRRSSPPRDGGRARDRDRPLDGGGDPGASRSHDRQLMSENWRRDGGADAHRATRDEQPRGLAGRWTVPADNRARTSKRSRPSSPEPAPDTRAGERAPGAKRPRIMQDNDAGFDSRRDGRGSSPARRDTRGSSPARRPRSPQTSSRQRSRRNRR